MISKKMRPYLLFTLVLTFGVLIFGGYLTKREKPPIPPTVVTVDAQTGLSRVVLKQEDITNGQNYYLSRGGQNIGTIWGHGSYLAPDWSADYLHREALYVAARHHGLSPERAAGFTQTDFDALSPEIRAVLTARVQQELRTNRYDAASATLTLTPYRAEAFENLNRYYTDLFKSGNEAMGLQPGIAKTDEQGRWIASFFSSSCGSWRSSGRPFCLTSSKALSLDPLLPRPCLSMSRNTCSRRAMVGACKWRAANTTSAGP